MQYIEKGSIRLEYFKLATILVHWGRHCTAHFRYTVQCRYNAISFLQILKVDTPQLTREGEVWGVCCEVIVRYTFCRCLRSAVFNIVINQAALQRHSTVLPSLNWKFARRIWNHSPVHWIFCGVEAIEMIFDMYSCHLSLKILSAFLHQCRMRMISGHCKG